jgi:hypothetical protein
MIKSLRSSLVTLISILILALEVVFIISNAVLEIHLSYTLALRECWIMDGAVYKILRHTFVHVY